MVAFSKWVRDDAESALRTAQGLGKFLSTQIGRMEAIIRHPRKKEDVQVRPHVRFNAQTLRELEQDWSHAQNDSLGYVAWLRFRLANEAERKLSKEEVELYAVMARYFRAIQYWKDLDSGAWEEGRKLNSSSVGVVMAGLREMGKYLEQKNKLPGCSPSLLGDLVKFGERTLKAQLPFEAPPQRRSDAALLFLIYPLQVVASEPMKQAILSLVRARLMGRVGIRRYIGDSYFCQDYDQWFTPETRSADFSQRLDFRDEFLEPGCEAQWCLFDPLMSVIYGRRYQADRARIGCLELQVEHFNRAIAQITPNNECPELYYLKRGEFVANEHTPLAWTQGNLVMALEYLEKSARTKQ
jgi:phosphorylase kinase alpha/beta subunit